VTLMAMIEPERFSHVAVMEADVLEWLKPVPSGLIVDATVGGAGHASAILDAFPNATLLGFDRDPLAVGVASERLGRFGGRAHVIHARFDDFEAARRQQNVERGQTFCSAVLFDLGVSSAQFDLSERGFSYRHDAPLDMRMDTSTGHTAADVVNSYSEAAIARILRVYSDERFASRIARALVAARPVLTTLQLVQVVTNAIPAATRRTGGHPAKRTFQALRIEVNDELRVLETALDAALDALVPGGRCIVLSYHSGEDRIVKDRFRLAESGGCQCPSGLPCVCGALPRGRMVQRGVVRPLEAEISANPRAASAVARVFVMAGPEAFVSGPGHRSPPTNVSRRESS
jgi:16S rRNA (cytosine1402-N4)-methyltransferase